MATTQRMIQRFYRHIRPLLHSSGLIAALHRAARPQRRAAIARFLGLSGYVSPLPPRTYVPHALARDGINFAADLRAETGVGESARSIFGAVQQTGVPVSYLEVETPFIRRRSLPVTALESPPLRAVTLAHLNAPELHLGMERYPEAFSQRYLIGYWLWEVPRFPDSWMSRLGALNELWTASRYSQNIFQRLTPLRVVHIPIPVEPVPASLNRSDFGFPDDRHIFFFAFNAASSVARKNPFAIIDAYQHAFAGQHAKPLLVIKASNLDAAAHPRLGAALRKAVRQVGGLLMEAHRSRAEMHSLIASVDTVISLHRAEGFGLLMAEAMALGKSTIATGYSGNVDFMNDQNSYLVNYQLCKIRKSDHQLQPDLAGVYEEGQLWAEPDVVHAAELMRQVIAMPTEAQACGQRARTDVEAMLSMRTVSASIRVRLEQIWASTGLVYPQ